MQELVYQKLALRTYFYQKSKQFQQEMRKNPTAAEWEMWQLIRRRQINGLRFNRQKIIGCFISDFVCLPKMLIIEVDSRERGFTKEYDKARSQYFYEQGFTILHFSKEKILNEPEFVRLRLRQVLGAISSCEMGL